MDRPETTTGDIIDLVGDWRSPVQLLQEQLLTSGPTVHDPQVAASLDLAGARIEGPTHFSQFVPLAMTIWGPEWLASGCISAHYKAPVAEGEQTQARLTSVRGTTFGEISMQTREGKIVLEGTVSAGVGAMETTCRTRLASARRPDDLQILDQVNIGMTSEPVRAQLTFDDPLGPLYPITLRQKLDTITEPHDWYWSGENPWRAPVVPIEMISPLLHEHNELRSIPISRPAIGLFLDQEICVHDGPLLVGEDYLIQREVAATGGSRSTESYWLRTTATDDAGRVRATMLLHVGFLRRTATG